MNLKVLKCPECRANLEIEDNRTSCYCQYCGCKIILDNEKQETTINKNINVTKNINKTNRYIDEAEIERVKAEDNQDKRSYKFVAWWWGILAIVLLGIILYFALAGKVAESQGKISAGYYKDLVGKDYESVEAHFEAAGFTNIELIDLDDSGLAFWTEDKVDTISVGGDTSFESTDWFDPDTKVVISYH